MITTRPTSQRRRAGRGGAARDKKVVVEYLIWGKFGEEDLLEWVPLKTLLKNDPEHMEFLDEREKGRAKAFKEEKKALLAELEEEEKEGEEQDE